jgi:hypothetical protein
LKKKIEKLKCYYFKKNIKVKLISFTQILIKSLINPYRLIKFNFSIIKLLVYLPPPNPPPPPPPNPPLPNPPPPPNPPPHLPPQTFTTKSTSTTKPATSSSSKEPFLELDSVTHCLRSDRRGYQSQFGSNSLKVSENPPQTCQRRWPISHSSTVGLT